MFRAQCADLTLNKTTNMDILKFTVTDTARQKIHLPVIFVWSEGHFSGGSAVFPTHLWLTELVGAGA